jgi:hypothetical protein
MPRGMPSLSPQVVWTRTRHFARSAPERDGSSRLPAMPASTTCPGLCLVSGHGQSGSERGETPAALPTMDPIHTAAFGRSNEADLVDALRRHNALTISLVAVKDGRLVGHIAFSPVTITSSTGTIEALGLAPMAVLPAY